MINCLVISSACPEYNRSGQHYGRFIMYETEIYLDGLRRKLFPTLYTVFFICIGIFALSSAASYFVSSHFFRSSIPLLTTVHANTDLPSLPLSTAPYVLSYIYGRTSRSAFPISCLKPCSPPRRTPCSRLSSASTPSSGDIPPRRTICTSSASPSSPAYSRLRSPSLRCTCTSPTSTASLRSCCVPAE